MFCSGLIKAALSAISICIIVIHSGILQCAYAQKNVPRTDENTLTYLGYGSVRSLDPAFVSINIEYQALQDLFDGLFYYDEHGKVAKGLVEQWTVDESKLIYTFNIAKDSYWSDGVQVTANDFVLQFHRLVDPELKNNIGKLSYLAKYIVNAEDIINSKQPVFKLGVTAVNDFTLRVKLKSPAPFITSILAHPAFYPIPSHVVKKHGNAWIEKENFVSNGSYLFDGYDGSDKFSMRKNHAHKHAKTTYFEYVELIRADDYNKASMMLYKNQADIINGFSSFNQIRLQSNVKVIVDSYSASSTSYFGFNLHNAKLKDVRVRQAMSLALLRDQLEDRLSAYLPIKAAYSYSSPYPELNWSGVRPDWLGDNTSKELIEKAQTLMRQAGYGPNNPLTLEVRYNESSKNERLISAASTMWARIWIKVIEVKASIFEHSAAISRGDFEVARFAWGADFDDPAAYFIPLSDNLKKHMPGAEQTEYYRLCQDLLTEQSDAERVELIEKLEKLIMQHVYIIPIFWQQIVSVVHADLEPVKFSYLRATLSRHVRPKKNR